VSVQPRGRLDLMGAVVPMIHAELCIIRQGRVSPDSEAGRARIRIANSILADARLRAGFARLEIHAHTGILSQGTALEVAKAIFYRVFDEVGSRVTGSQNARAFALLEENMRKTPPPQGLVEMLGEHAPDVNHIAIQNKAAGKKGSLAF